MKDRSSGLIIEISIGVVIGALLAISGLLCLMVLILVPSYQTHQWARKQNHQEHLYRPASQYDLQKATYNFTSLIGQGAFGPVYKAQMTAGEAVAVKEFQTEVMLLGRLHHRNLVNFLVGYYAEKGQRMLIYVYAV
ncbi:hypothetical protein L1887_39459 [Cichorium endivia]|nr:hypothetical protein L1887_39459 [Cichorium endivia]